MTVTFCQQFVTEVTISPCLHFDVLVRNDCLVSGEIFTHFLKGYGHQSYATLQKNGERICVYAVRDFAALNENAACCG